MGVILRLPVPAEVLTRSSTKSSTCGVAPVLCFLCFFSHANTILSCASSMLVSASRSMSLACSMRLHSAVAS